MSDAAKKKPAPMKTIGVMPCLLCAESVPVKQQSNGYAAISCSWCGVQLYTRSDDSNGRLRQKMKPLAVAVAAALEVKPPKEATPLPKPAAPAPAAKKSFLEEL